MKRSHIFLVMFSTALQMMIAHQCHAQNQFGGRRVLSDDITLTSPDMGIKLFEGEGGCLHAVTFGEWTRGYQPCVAVDQFSINDITYLDLGRPIGLEYDSSSGDSLLLTSEGLYTLSQGQLTEVPMGYRFGNEQAEMKDFNNDGKLDFLYFSRNTLWLALQDSILRFDSEPLDFMPNVPMDFVRSRDINGDNIPDIFVIAQENTVLHEIHILISKGPLDYEVFTINPTHFTLNTHFIDVLDCDGDGDLDVLFGGIDWEIYGDDLMYIENQDFHFESLKTFVPKRENLVGRSTDIDGDGDLDFVTLETETFQEYYELILYENQGNGQFDIQVIDHLERPDSYTWMVSSQSLDIWIDFVDLDFDGDDDIVFNSLEESKVLYYLNQRISATKAVDFSTLLTISPSINNGIFTMSLPASLIIEDMVITDVRGTITPIMQWDQSGSILSIFSDDQGSGLRCVSLTGKDGRKFVAKYLQL